MLRFSIGDGTALLCCLSMDVQFICCSSCSRCCFSLVTKSCSCHLAQHMQALAPPRLLLDVLFHCSLFVRSTRDCFRAAHTNHTTALHALLILATSVLEHESLYLDALPGVSSASRNVHLAIFPLQTVEWLVRDSGQPHNGYSCERIGNGCWNSVCM